KTLNITIIKANFTLLTWSLMKIYVMAIKCKVENLFVYFWMLGVSVLEEKDMTITHAISTERLVHVLQSIVLKQQTGRLSIEHFGEQESEKGEIFFAHGDTVFVRTQQEVGEAALSRIMSWRAVQYTFFEEAQTPTG